MKRNLQYPSPEQQAKAAALRAAPSFVLLWVGIVFLSGAAALLVQKWLELELGWAEMLLEASLFSVISLPILYVLIVRRLLRIVTQETATAADRRFHAISSEISDGILITDDHANILLANPAAERIYAAARGQLVRRNMESFIPPDRLEVFRTDLKLARESGTGLVTGRGATEVEGLRSSGERFPLEISINPVEEGGRLRFVRVVRDISERKRIEGELTRLASFAEASPNFVLECEPEGEILYANPSARQVFGPAAHGKARINSLIPGFKAIARDCLTGRQIRFDLETEVDGRAFLWTLQPFPERGHILAFATDITKRKAAEAALTQSEQQLRDLLDTLPLAIRVVQDEKTVFANTAAARLFGLASARQLMGTDPQQLVAPRDRQRLAEYHRQRARSEESPPQYEAAYLRSDGSEFPAEIIATPFLYEGKPGSLAVIRDLTEEKRLRLYEQILPVCCVCGKIRDDSKKGKGQGAWGRLDHFVMRHSNTQLSHTFCPDCLEDYKHKQGLR